MLKAIIGRHTASILSAFQYYLQTGFTRAVFGPPGVVTRVTERKSHLIFLYHTYLLFWVGQLDHPLFAFIFAQASWLSLRLTLGRVG